MKLIVGLGNPGRIYKDSRHNIGIRVIQNLAKVYKIKLTKEKDSLSKEGRGKVKDIALVLAHPLTFMNLSGESISLLLKKYKLFIENLLVICDDLDLKLGEIRIRQRGSSAGHKGIKSIIEHLRANNFSRLRIGIGRPISKNKIKDFVLSSFSKEEEVIIKKTIDKAVNCCRVWLFDGLTQAMNRFN